MKKTIFRYLLFSLLLGFPMLMQAQYFGKNKPRYEKFDFDVNESEHFKIYSYVENPDLLRALAYRAEAWYGCHQAILKDTIEGKNPLMIYNNHADFQQTNAVSGSIGVGTGGVTEVLKNRVIFPLSMTNAQDNHVLGHELVHAFQYNMILQGDSTNIQNLGNLPLWMVEGMAEYMSIGSVDSHTSMWMRDAVASDDFPSIKKLNDAKYFPYRYGQAFWAFVAGLKGDTVIAPYFKSTAMYGLEAATKKELGMGTKNLSELWKRATINHYQAAIDKERPKIPGKKLISDENAGQMNISPSISPNGKYVAFMSNKNVLTTDIFIADARKGEILGKISSAVKDSHLDDYNFYESSGTWSPNSKQFAFVGVKKGRNVLVIKDALKGNIVNEIFIKELQAFSYPAWSPDGKTIVLTGLQNGQTDLYALTLKNNTLTQLTNDKYAEIATSWSIDGSKLVYATDALSMKDHIQPGDWIFNIAVYDMQTATAQNLDLFPGANNLNPLIDSTNVWFLSDRDGFRNMYRYDLKEKKLYQTTDILTGISGITPYSPAITLARKRGRIIYSLFKNGKYTLYSVKPEQLMNKEVSANDVQMDMAQLPNVDNVGRSRVTQQLAIFSAGNSAKALVLEPQKYQPNFKLDYIGGSAGVGVGNSQMFGTTTGAVGGVDMLFSDILGNNQFFSSLALNGEISDFGGAVAYMNKNNRINWGASISHVPYRSGYIDYQGVKTIDLYGLPTLVEHYQYYVNRLFEEKVGLFAQYPFSTKLRWEASAYYAYYSDRTDRYDYYYNAYGQLLAQEKTKLDNEGITFNLMNVGTALVGDNSYFGLTAPLNGSRYRFGIDQYIGGYDFTALTADYRFYRFFKPVGIAFRAMHYGRYGGNSDDLYPLYIGSPWYVRGFTTNNSISILQNSGKDFNRLFGTKIFVGNFEFRVPFIGPEQLSLIKSKVFFSDLNLFVDGGFAWTHFDEFGENALSNITPVYSAGVSLRINVMGAIVIEPFYAIPLEKNTKGSFGLNLIPGW